MRDNFNHWFVMTILFAMFLGAELARIEFDRHDWVLVGFYGAIAFGAGVGAISSHRQLTKGADHG